jgi:hypothetical protein
MWIESNPPPAYATYVVVPPSCEATTAPAYTPRQTSPDQAGTSSPSSRASRHLPPSRPLQRSDRLELTNQSTTINIGRPSERDEECGNTSNSSSKSSKSDTCFDLVAAIFALCFVSMFVTMVCTAIFLTEDAAALKESSRVLDRVYGPRHTVT